MMRGRLFLSSTALVLTAQVMSKVVGFFFLVYVARRLGVSEYGTYAFIVSLVGMLGVLVDFGINTITVRTLSRDPDHVSTLFWANAALRVPLWTVLMAVVLGTLAALGRVDAFPVAILLVLAALPAIFAQVVISILNALGRYRWMSMLLLLSVALTVLTGVLALHSGSGLVGLATAGAATSTIHTILALRLASVVGVRFRLQLPSAAYVRGLVAQALPLGLSLLFVTVYYKIDRVLISLLLGDVYVGWYDVAYRFLDGLMVIPSSIVLVAFPVLSRVLQAGPDPTALALVRRGTRWMFALALPIAAALSLLARPVMDALFGGQYGESGRVLHLLVWAAAFMFPNAFLGNALVACNRQTHLAVIVGVGVIVNVALNLMLLPRLGIDGAVIATIAAEAWGFLGVTLSLGRHLGSYAFLKEALRPAGVAVIVSGMIIALPGLSFLVLLPLLGVMYLALSFLFGSLNVEEAASFLGFPRHFGHSGHPS